MSLFIIMKESASQNPTVRFVYLLISRTHIWIALVFSNSCIKIIDVVKLFSAPVSWIAPVATVVLLAVVVLFMALYCKFKEKLHRCCFISSSSSSYIMSCPALTLHVRSNVLLSLAGGGTVARSETPTLL